MLTLVGLKSKLFYCLYIMLTIELDINCINKRITVRSLVNMSKTLNCNFLILLFLKLRVFKDTYNEDLFFLMNLFKKFIRKLHNFKLKNIA